MTPPRLDFARLLKLRLVVARYGEMDVARWWNTKGMLGRHGAGALKRGLPRSHLFAQARVVFAVARSRCRELFAPPQGCMTLWRLTPGIEDGFEERWQGWLEEVDVWQPFFSELAAVDGGDLLEILDGFDLLSDSLADTVSGLQRSAEGRAVPLSGSHPPDDDAVGLLAAGFSRGEPGSPAIPYARVEAPG